MMITLCNDSHDDNSHEPNGRTLRHASGNKLQNTPPPPPPQTKLDHGWPPKASQPGDDSRASFLLDVVTSNTQQLTLFLLSCHLSDPPSHEFAKHVKDDTYTALAQNSDYNAHDSHDDSVQ